MSASGKGNFPLTFVLQVQGAEQVTSKFNQVKSGLQGTNQAVTPLNQNLATTDKNLLSAGDAASSTGKKIQQSSGQIRQGSTAVADLGNSSDTTSKKTEGLAQKFQRNKGLIFGLTMLTSGILEAQGMFSMWADANEKISASQDALNKVVAGGIEGTESYQRALEKRNAAQEKVNDLVARGKTDTPAYTKAVRELDKAQGALNQIQEGGIQGTKEYQAATDDLAEAQRGMRFVQRNMILSLTDLIPLTLMTVSGIMNLRSATEGAAAATTGMTKAMKVARVAMVALPLAGIGLALLAIRNNTFGFRDALEDLGKKIGNAFPQLKGFLTWVHDLGEALGLTGKNLDLTKAWDIFVKGFQSAWDQISKFDWGKLLSDMVTNITNWVKDPKNWVRAGEAIVNGLIAAVKWTQQNILPALKGLADQALTWAKNPTNWVNVGKAIATGIGAAVVFVATEVHARLKPYVDFAVKWATTPSNWVDLGKKIGSGIVGGVVFIASEIAKKATEFGKAIGDAILKFPWADVGKGIWNTILQGLSSAGEGLGGIGKSVQDFFGQLFSGGGQDKNPFTPIAFTQGGKGGGAGFGIASALTQEMALAMKVVTNGTAQISAQFNTMRQSITNTMAMVKTAIGQTMTTAMATVVTAVTQGTTNISASVLTMKQSVTTSIAQVQQIFSTLSTSITTYMSSMATSIQGFVTKATTSLTSLGTATKTVHTALSSMSTSVTTYANSMATAIAGFASKSVSSFNTVSSAVKTTQNALSNMSTSVSTYMSGMTSKVNSFGSAASSSFSKVRSSADAATKSVKQLQAAINSLRDKTVTITTRYRTVGTRSVQHGGSWIASGQHGFSALVNQPTTFKGVRMGEGFRPELVTVQPLTRGTGNHGGPTVSSSVGGGGGPQRDIIVPITVVLDSRVIQRFVEKVALNNIGLQV